MVLPNNVQINYCMKLFYVKGSCSLNPRIIINELNLNVEFVKITERKTPNGDDYLKINPKGSVPALQLDNGEVLTEGAIITHYLADTYKNTKLLPEIGNFKRYRVLEMVNHIATDLHKTCSPVFNKQVPDDIKASIFKPALINRLQHIDSILSKNDYITGSEFTIADSYLFVILTWMAYLQVDISQMVNIQKFIQKVSTRPSVVKSLSDEQK